MTSALSDDAIATYRGDDSLAGVAVAEMYDAVVVADHFHVLNVVRIAKCEQLRRKIADKALRSSNDAMWDGGRR